MVRSFVGGLQLITNLLRSDDKQVIIRKTNSHFFAFAQDCLTARGLSVKEIKSWLTTK